MSSDTGPFHGLPFPHRPEGALSRALVPEREVFLWGQQAVLLCTWSGKGDRTPRSLGAQTQMGNNKEKQEDDRFTAGGSWP